MKIWMGWGLGGEHLYPSPGDVELARLSWLLAPGCTTGEAAGPCCCCDRAWSVFFFLFVFCMLFLCLCVLFLSCPPCSPVPAVLLESSPTLLHPGPGLPRPSFLPRAGCPASSVLPHTALVLLLLLFLPASQEAAYLLCFENSRSWKGQ